MQKPFLKQADASKFAKNEFQEWENNWLSLITLAPKLSFRCNFSIPQLGLGSSRLKNGNSPNRSDHLRSMIFLNFLHSNHHSYLWQTNFNITVKEKNKQISRISISSWKRQVNTNSSHEIPQKKKTDKNGGGKVAAPPKSPPRKRCANQSKGEAEAFRRGSGDHCGQSTDDRQGNGFFLRDY